MSDVTKILLVTLLFLVGVFAFVKVNSDCDAGGGRMMKTLYNTYECVYEVKK